MRARTSAGCLRWCGCMGALEIRHRADDGPVGQTVSVIAPSRSDRLLRRGEPQRGRVGQPIGPPVARPEGAFFLRGQDRPAQPRPRSGGFRRHDPPSGDKTYPYPTPAATIARILDEIEICTRLLGPATERVAGLGLANLSRSGNGPRRPARPPRGFSARRDTDIRAELAMHLPGRSICRTTPPPPAGRNSPSAIMPGCRTSSISISAPSSAAASCSMAGSSPGAPAMPPRSARCRSGDGKGGTQQLIDRASLVLLERQLRAAGLQAEPLYDPEADWSGFGHYLDEWIAGHPAASPIRSPRRARSSISKRRSSTVPSEAGSGPPRSRPSPRSSARSTCRASSRRVYVPAASARSRALGGASLPLFGPLSRRPAHAGRRPRPERTGRPGHPDQRAPRLGHRPPGNIVITRAARPARPGRQCARIPGPPPASFREPTASSNIASASSRRPMIASSAPRSSRCCTSEGVSARAMIRTVGLAADPLDHSRARLEHVRDRHEDPARRAPIGGVEHLGPAALPR